MKIIIPSQAEVSEFPVHHEESLLASGEPFKSIVTRDDVLNKPIKCYDCEDGYMNIDPLLSEEASLLEGAQRMNMFDFTPMKPVVVYRCMSCGSHGDARELPLRKTKLVKKQVDLREVARACEPKKGQTWAAKRGLPVETCPINKNPCYKELWKVCPHIGNDGFSDLVNSPGIVKLET